MADERTEESAALENEGHPMRRLLTMVLAVFVLGAAPALAEPVTAPLAITKNLNGRGWGVFGGLAPFGGAVNLWPATTSVAKALEKASATVPQNPFMTCTVTVDPDFAIPAADATHVLTLKVKSCH
jgi:hypothetical protein